MNQTPNYKLNQWEADDRVQRTDFNADNAKIDAAIQAVKTTLSAQVNNLAASKADKTALAAFGNCRIEFGSYQGDGKDNRIMTITTGIKPMVLLVLDENCNIMCRGEPSAYTFYRGSLTSSVVVTWGENSVSWKPQLSSYKAPAFLNDTHLYHYIVLG